MGHPGFCGALRVFRHIYARTQRCVLVRRDFDNTSDRLKHIHKSPPGCSVSTVRRIRPSHSSPRLCVCGRYPVVLARHILLQLFPQCLVRLWAAPRRPARPGPVLTFPYSLLACTPSLLLFFWVYASKAFPTGAWTRRPHPAHRLCV